MALLEPEGRSNCCDICNYPCTSTTTSALADEDDLCSDCRMRVDELTADSKAALFRFLGGNVL